MFTVKWYPNSQSFFFFSTIFTGSMTILPTVLFLITGVLRETAVKTSDNLVPLPVSAALQGIKTIITSPLARVESMQTQWTSLVRSSLASVLEYSQPGGQMQVTLTLLWKTKTLVSFLTEHASMCVYFFRWVQTWYGWGQYVDSDYALPAVCQQWTCRSDSPAEGLHGPLPQRPEL